MAARLIAIGAALVAVVASSCAPTLSARPRLVAAWPMSGASLSVAGHTLDLTFNRPLDAALTSAAVERPEDGSTLLTSATVDPANARHLQVKLMEPSAGSYVLHWHAVGLRSTEPADGDQTFSLQKDASAPPRVNISPATADKGEVLDLVGKGFARESPVRLAIGDDEQALATVQTDARGTFNAEAKVPDSLPLGEQPVTAVDSEGRIATAAIQVHWGGWPPAVATDIGEPGPKPGEVTFTLSVRNRSDYMLEHVQLVIQDPPGAMLVNADPSPRRQADTLAWDIPVMDRGLVSPFHATYRSAEAVVSHAWLEFRHRHRSACGRDDCLPAFISESTSESLLVAPAPEILPAEAGAAATSSH
jgi:methionine-rich copper-binding protein CopC